MRRLRPTATGVDDDVAAHHDATVEDELLGAVAAEIGDGTGQPRVQACGRGVGRHRQLDTPRLRRVRRLATQNRFQLAVLP